MTSSRVYGQYDIELDKPKDKYDQFSCLRPETPVFGKGKQTVWGGCLLKGIQFFVFIGRLMVPPTGVGAFFQSSGPAGWGPENLISILLRFGSLL